MAKKIKRWFIGGGILAAAVFLLSNPRAASSGALQGIMLSGKVAIPSLFPMTFLTVMLCRISGGGMISVWLLSMISGYPVGARLIKNRFALGAITEKQAKRGMLFCVNAGPAFVVTAVGCVCLGNIKLGWLLLAAHILGSLAVFLLFKKGALQKKEVSAGEEDFLDVFTLSAYESAQAMIQICGWVILFSAFCEVMRQSGLPTILKTILLSTAEITSAITLHKAPVLLSFLLGFGGLCVHFQVLSAGREIRPKYFLFFLARILHGGISAGACYLLLKCFPISVETAKIELSYARENNLLAFCSLILTFVVFIFSLKNRRKV